MTRMLAILVLLLLGGCDGADEGWLHGYAEGEYVRLGAPAAGWLEERTGAARRPGRGRGAAVSPGGRQAAGGRVPRRRRSLLVPAPSSPT